MARHPREAIQAGARPLLRGYLYSLQEQQAANPRHYEQYASTISLIEDVLYNKLARYD